MKMEKQVVSLESAQRLAELGVSRHCLFYWELNKANKYFKGRVAYGDPSIDNAWSIPFPAYTVAELGEMLPGHIASKAGTHYLLSTVNNYGEMIVWYENEWGDNFKGESFNDDSEADARALMLVWLIENGHLLVDEINTGTSAEGAK